MRYRANEAARRPGEAAARYVNPRAAPPGWALRRPGRETRPGAEKDGRPLLREGRATRRFPARPLLELAVGYGLILATIWSQRPAQQWLYLASLLWVAGSTWYAFPGWTAMGFRLAGLRSSLWVPAVALGLSGVAVIVAGHLQTLRTPHTFGKWVLTFGGYAVWSFAQQFLLQGYFLFRLLHLLPRREFAAFAAAGIFALAHLPNPILTPLTLLWGTCACFVFLRSRNVYPLAAAHAVLGITVAVTIPGPLIHNMRVGLGYLHYHAPARDRTPLPHAVP